MATLKPTLSLVSTDVGADSVSFSISDSLTVNSASTNISRKNVATGSAQDVLASNSSFSYVFLHNVSSSDAAAFVQVKLGGTATMKLSVGEFAFVPMYSSIAITAEAFTAACVLEYGQWIR